MDDATDQASPGHGPLTLIGTGHVLDISAKIDDAIRALRPDVVFVELDRGRLQALVARRAGHTQPPADKWVQRRLQSFQENIAAEYGVQAGDEMLGAVDAGFAVGADVQLVDRPIHQTLQRVTKQITWSERFRLLGTFAGGAIRSLFSRRSTRSVVEKELADYNADPATVMEKLATDYPTIYRVLIAERDEWMARRIRNGLQDGRSGVAIVGDGHIGGLLGHLDGIEVETFRLPDVQAGRLPAPDPEDTSSVSIGFDLSQ